MTHAQPCAQKRSSKSSLILRIENEATAQNRGNAPNQKTDDTAPLRVMDGKSDPSQKWEIDPSRRRVAREKKEDDRHRKRENEVPVAIVIKAAQK